MARPNLTPAPTLMYVVELKNFKNKLVMRQEYPTYGSAMRAVVHFEEKFPEYTVEYKDKNYFK
jgi:hypothetical protein